MTAVQHHPHVDVLVERDIVTHENTRRGLAVLRLGFGLTFLWAFFDKLLALGFATGRNAETGVVDRYGPDAWVNGGSPTFGFLNFGVPEDSRQMQWAYAAARGACSGRNGRVPG